MGTVSVLESLRAALHRPTDNSLRTPLELRAPAGAPFYHMPCAQNHAAAPRVRARRARMGTVSVLESLRAALHRPTDNSLRTPLELRAPAGAPPLVLRTMTVRDEQVWDAVRMRNADWLEPWESNGSRTRL